jgi:hypothetical protein
MKFSRKKTILGDISYIGVITLTACSILSTMPAKAIVNGVDADNPDFQAVVFIGGCTGTFIHPHFILTATHCIPNCPDNNSVGCVTDKDKAIGRDGTISRYAWDGKIPREGNMYEIDFVYFARATDIGRSRAPDVALLRTTTPFTGKIIPVLNHQDRPRPDENNYCPRWEFTWPWVLGYSNNADSTDVRRRVGRAFAECDLELDKTVFKLDGHGRSGQRGIRVCRGDSGGPVLWETGFGNFAVGGVNSRTDNYKVLTDTRCPSERGEGFHAFIPQAFLDRVARSDFRCYGAESWESCPAVPPAYDGIRLIYRGTKIDQCGSSVLKISSTQRDANIARGGTGTAELESPRFAWYCGDSLEWTSARHDVNFVIAKRGLTDRQIIWDTYERTFHEWITPIMKYMMK